MYLHRPHKMYKGRWKLTYCLDIVRVQFDPIGVETTTCICNRIIARTCMGMRKEPVWLQHVVYGRCSDRTMQNTGAVEPVHIYRYDLETSEVETRAPPNAGCELLHVQLEYMHAAVSVEHQHVSVHCALTPQLLSALFG